MAEALFRDRIRKERSDWLEWQVESAGTWAQEGEPASRFSQQVMSQCGLDISAHRSRLATEALVRSSDLVLTMEERHKEALQMAFPAFSERIFLLDEMRGGFESVQDPYGGTIEEYEETALHLENLIEQGMGRIILLAGLDKLGRK